MLDQILTLLGNIGLRDKEAQIYATCLEVSDGLYPYEIVERTGLNRSTVDVLVDKLMESRHLTRGRVGRRYKYFAKDPNALFHEQAQILETFKGLLPLLEQMQTKKGNMEFRFFEGVDGIDEIFRDLDLRLRLGQGRPNEQLLITSWEDPVSAYPDYMNVVRRRIASRIPIRILTPYTKDPISNNDPKQLRQSRSFDATKFPFKIHLQIYGDTINIISPIEPYGSIMLVNDVIAQSMRSLFDMLWESRA